MEKPVRVKWNDSFYVKTYELVISGLNESQIAKTLGVTSATFTAWKEMRPALIEAIEKGKIAKSKLEEKTNITNCHNLSPELQELWDKILLCDNIRNGLDRMESLLIDAGKGARQRLFIFCLIKNNFDVTQACRRLNINKTTLTKWVREDIEFSDMLKEIDWYKGNFYENALVRLVAEGDTNAVIFANKTYNKDRGYSDKLEIQSSVQHTHLHAHFTIDDLELPISTRMEILEAIRRKKEKDIPPDRVIEGRLVSGDQKESGLGGGAGEKKEGGFLQSFPGQN